jgi:hypothetical protein
MIVGLISNSYLGEEITHYRFARGTFTERARITFQFFELIFKNQELSL